MQLFVVSALATTMVGLTLLSTRGRRRHRSTRRGVLVRVHSRYEPATILATAGEPILLRFRRETFAASGGRVIFPALGKSIELPLFDEVTLELLLDPGRYEFTCEQGLLRGVLEVEERRRPRALQLVPLGHRSRARLAASSSHVPIDSTPVDGGKAA
jgi:plastocyanin domain-containing protein